MMPKPPFPCIVAVNYSSQVVPGVFLYSFSCSRHSSDEAKLKWSYKHGDGSVPFVGITIGKKLEETVEKHPHKEAHIFCRDDVRLSFESLLEKVGVGCIH